MLLGVLSGVMFLTPGADVSGLPLMTVTVAAFLSEPLQRWL